MHKGAKLMKTSIEDVEIGNCKVSIKVVGDYLSEIRRLMAWLETSLTEAIGTKPSIPETPIEINATIATTPVQPPVVVEVVVQPPPTLTPSTTPPQAASAPLSCLGIVPADFPTEAKTTRDVVRVIFGKGVREFDDVVKVCTTLKNEVRVLQHINVETVLPRAYKMVLAEEASAEK
jgi:hypothetical protein